MSRVLRTVLTTALSAAACIAFAPAAQAGGDYDSRYGADHSSAEQYSSDHYGSDRYGASGDDDWSAAEAICRQTARDERDCRWSGGEARERDEVEVLTRDVYVRPAVFETVNVPDSFFADTGGVGPAFADYGGGGGGGYVIAEGGAFAGASASASASARVSVSIGFRGHGGGGGGYRPPSHGCGCSHH